MGWQLVCLWWLLYLGLLACIGSGTVYACYQGKRALWRSTFWYNTGRQGDYALTLRMLGLNLCEPLVNTLLALFLAILFFPTWFNETLGFLALNEERTWFSENLAVPALLTPAILPLVVVGMAAVGIHISTRGTRLSMYPYRYLYSNMLWLSLGRLGVTIAMQVVLWIWANHITAADYFGWKWSLNIPSPDILRCVGIFYLVAIPLHWWTALWGRHQLNSTLQRPPPVSSISAPPPVPIAPPAIATTPLPDSVLTEPPVPYLLCPLCHAPAPHSAAMCPACGLVFASRVPSALHTLADYHVLRPLGGGGMSSVYLARPQQDDHLVVIKTLASVETLADPHWHTKAARCLRQEADLLRQLDHPHIAQVREWISSDQGEFLVLEYVPGLTLEQCLTRLDGQGHILPGQPLPVNEVLGYGCTVASLLEYLACLPQPLVHHDIKPANLIVREEDGVLVLVDFGGAGVLPDSDAATVQLDRYGTPGYAAPEQYQGHSSPQSDIYGLAATLYHLLTDDDPADHPFRFPHLAALPAGVRTVLEPALTHEPNARPTAQTLRRALQMVLHGHAGDPQPEFKRGMSAPVS